MIVQRETFKVRPGHMSEFIELIKAEDERVGRTDRIYHVEWGARDTVIVEFEFETEEERQKFWDDRNAQPEATEFGKRYNELRVSGGTSELLLLY